MAVCLGVDEGINPNQGLQTGCSDSVLRKGVPVSNTNSPQEKEKENTCLVVISGVWGLEGVAVLMAGLSVWRFMWTSSSSQFSSIQLKNFNHPTRGNFVVVMAGCRPPTSL